eukprot:gene23335-30584_t
MNQSDSDDGEVESLSKRKGRLTAWEENIPLLYTFFIQKNLDWPSLTVDWIPAHPGGQPGPTQASQGQHPVKLVVGTQTSGQEPNVLMVCSLSKGDLDNCGDQGGPVLRVESVFQHEGDVDRARAMPQNPDLVATKCIGSHIIASAPPIATYTMEGSVVPDSFGFAWSPALEGALLSTCSEGRIALLNVELGLSPNSRDDDDSPATASTLDEAPPASQTSYLHSRGQSVNDVTFFPASSDPHCFGSVGDNGQLVLWDMRLPPGAAAVSRLEAHSGAAVNSLAFSLLQPYSLATCSTRRSIKGNQLRMIHAGHVGSVSDMAWAPAGSWAEGMVASVSDMLLDEQDEEMQGNVMQIWKVDAT